MTINVNLIATRKYSVFVQSLINDIKNHLLLGHNIEVNLFTDNPLNRYVGDERVVIKKFAILPYGFPAATMYRYAIMSSIEYDCDYILYFDVDMAIIDNIEPDEILGDIIAVRHPGFYMSGGSWETNEKSTSYVPPEKRVKYWAGGVQGGATKEYVKAMQWMKEAIDEDEKHGIVPVWHDESAWNKYLSECETFKELNPAFCMVEEIKLREAWGIINILPKIIALSKDHKFIRE